LTYQKCHVDIHNMRDMHLRGLDLNLLPVLEALLRQANVTRAAAEIGLSQPAMSRALARLRDLFNDALLVRAAGGMTLTPRARELIGPVASAMRSVKSIYAAPELSLASIRRTVRICASDAQTVLLAPLIAARLHREAPHVDIEMTSYSRDLAARMETGQIDFAFATASTPLPPGAASMPLAEDRLALVMRREHPAANRNWTIADYASVDHVSISILGDGVSDLDAALAAQGVSRRIMLTTPHFTAALAAVSSTDMVTTISRIFARRFATPFDLVLHEPPLQHTELTLVLVWARLQASDPFLAFMRRVIADAAQDAQTAYGGA
jgi:DNA-binding transcriptional LysR family regulator